MREPVSRGKSDSGALLILKKRKANFDYKRVGVCFFKGQYYMDIVESYPFMEISIV
jgi:hypothetical protein